MAQAGTQPPLENKVPASVTVMAVFYPLQLMKQCSDGNRWVDRSRKVKTDDSTLSIPLNPGRSKNGIHKEGKHNKSAVLIKICRWMRFFVGKEWAVRCVSLVMLEGKKVFDHHICMWALTDDG